MSDAQFRAAVSELRKMVPTLLPVRVYLRDSLEGNALGLASLKKSGGRAKHFVIEVKRASWQVMKDTLLHEWAHCLAWQEGNEFYEDHGPEWGLAMSRVYQLMVSP